MRWLPILLLCGCSAATTLEPQGVSEMNVGDAGLEDGGADAGEVVCTTIDFSAPSEVRAQYFLSFFDGANMVELRTGSDSLTFELWYRGLNEQATFPWPVMLWPTHRAECETCVVLRRGCVGDVCARTLFAIGGQVTFDDATRNPLAGHFSGSANVVRLVECCARDDEAMPSGECVELRDVSWDAGWAFDGGP